MKSSQVNYQENKKFKLVKVKNGKYYVSFPKLSTPVVMNEYFFKQLEKENKNKA